MTRRSALGGGGYKLGDLRQMSAHKTPVLFVDGAQEFLSTGYIEPNTGGKYNELLALGHQYGCYYPQSFIAEGLTAPSNPPGVAQGKFFHALYVAPNYFLFPPLGDSQPNFAIGTSLASLGLFNGTGFPASQALTGVAVVGGTVVVSTSDASTAGSICAVNSGGTVNPTGPSGSAMVGLASSGSLGVAIRPVISNAASGIYTSTNGTTWTGRNGTLGTLNPMQGIHWSSALNRFFVWAGSGAILSNTDGFTHSVARAANNDFVLPTESGSYATSLQTYAASGAGCFMLAARRASDGLTGFLRTTDGTSWTFVGPGLNSGLPAQAGGFNPAGVREPGFLRIQWDAIRSRFIACSIQAGTFFTDAPAYYHSSDGITWLASAPFYTAGTARFGFGGFQSPNGQDIAAVWVPAANGSISSGFSLVAGSLLSGAPGHVGCLLAQSPPSISSRLYMRIK